MKSAFLMHPLDASYVRRSWHSLAKIWANLLPDFAIEFILKHVKPFVQGRFKIKDHESMIIICPLTSRQMKILPKEIVLDRLKQACDLAYTNGAEVISLGAYSAIASNQGLDLAGKVEIGITTGRAYTVYSVIEQAKPFMKKDSLIAVVGVNGAIGSTVSRLMDKYKIIKINKENIQEVYSADMIISASSDINNIIDVDKLKKNAVVIDAAKPSDISRNIKREDVKIIDGGFVRVPGDVDFGIKFDCPPNTVYACMAEAFILAMDDHKGNYCIGKEIKMEMVEEIGKLGDKFGFEVV